jgi:CheY-like chemotaxis protein
MSGDLLTLRVIVASASRPVRQIWREGVGQASVPMEFDEADGGEVRSMLAKGNVDIVLLDAALGDEERAAAIKAARALKPVPLIVLSAPSAGGMSGDAHTVLPTPKTSAEARGLIERCIHMRMPKRILIVDDSTTMRSIVRKILSASRYVLEASEADEGMEALKRIDRGVDVVLLDYNMPGFNGFETLAEIKRVAPHVAVVMMTSTIDDALAARAESSGAAAFLKKPFYPADIDAVLDKIYAK